MSKLYARITGSDGLLIRTSAVCTVRDVQSDNWKSCRETMLKMVEQQVSDALDQIEKDYSK